MKKGVAAVAVLLTWLWASPSGAVFFDEAKTIQLTGKVLAQGSLRVEDSDSGGRNCLLSGGAVCEDFSFPTTKAGQLIQERNLIDMEFFHDVAGWLGHDFTLLDGLSYRIRAKYFYDTLYDGGPSAYRDTNSHPFATDRDGLRKAAHLAQQHDPLWNAYVDVAKGPLHMRVGRQDLSWGESDGFRLLDMIEPLDNRFGFPLVENLDDRRIPLWMVRPTLRIGRVGPFSNLSVDGYWVPGTIDDQEAPITPTGNPFAAPNPPGESIVKIPSKNLGNSRGGGRIIGSTFNNNLTFSIGHYVTFNDYPSVRLLVRDVNFVPIGPDLSMMIPDASFLVEFYQQQVTGASATFALPFDPWTIVRAEIAHFWDERVFIPAVNVDLAMQRFFATGMESVGDLPTKNVLRWMIGLDRNVWLRWLNPTNTFYLSGQYFHTNIFNFERSITTAVANRTMTVEASPGTLATAYNFVNRRNDEILITYLVNTLYYHGNVQPQVFGMYDTRGVHAVVPSVSYQWGTNFQFSLSYAMTLGNLANQGFFRDRDQVQFRVQYNLS